MNQWKVILAALVIFAAGAGTGALTMKLVQPPARTVANPVAPQSAGVINSTNNPPRPGPPGPPGPERHAQYFLKRMQERLKLTPEQSQRVLIIMTNSQERMKLEFQSVQEQISKELTPEQMEKFKEAFSRPPDRRRGDGERGDRGERDGRDWDRDKDRSRSGDKSDSNNVPDEPKRDN